MFAEARLSAAVVPQQWPQVIEPQIARAEGDTLVTLI
jgi:hypothetical protein